MATTPERYVEQRLRVPIINDYDVIVCGGGPAGIGAAITAGRLGLQVLLIEQYGYLGGMWTAGLVTPLFDSAGKGGLVEEIIGHLRARQAYGGFGAISFDYEELKVLLDQLTLEAGVSILFHTFVVDVIMQDSTLTGVIVENKTGRQGFRGKVIIDCTGDGDVAYRAGIPYAMGRPEDGLVQPMTTMFRLGNVQYKQRIRGELYNLMTQAMAAGADYAPPYTNPWIIDIPHAHEVGDVAVQLTHIRNRNPIDAWDLSAAELEGRCQAYNTYQLFKNHIPELKDVFLSETPVQIGVRESRRIQGEYVLSGDDVLTARAFADGVVRCTFNIDIHDPVGLGQIRQIRKNKGAYHIPLRSLVPVQVDQLLIAGRCISGDHTALASYRVTGNCVAMGQAAGTAACEAIRSQVAVRHIDPQAVRSSLVAQGVNLEAGPV